MIPKGWKPDGKQSQCIRERVVASSTKSFHDLAATIVDVAFAVGHSSQAEELVEAVPSEIHLFCKTCVALGDFVKTKLLENSSPC